MPANRLADCLSPYLLQHADNPVDWYPWGPEALNRAREEDKPILLSIGYSACHWCHVMAHESFEDADIAGRMNRYFVNIKVDREERPDLDRLYQLAHQLLAGRGGGWPLTVFLDPTDLKPFFAGTYFPATRRGGMIAFPELLERIHQVWTTRREEVRVQNEQLGQALAMLSEPRPGDPDKSGQDPGAALIGQLAQRFDRDHGGFGGAPKFPQAPLLAWLADQADDEQAAQMLHDTLDGMARAGLQDHLGGGFFRYSVDAAWEIPHFEKMLYDNAQLLDLYAGAAARWNDAGLAGVARGIVGWMGAEMALEGGGFAASLDADNADGEGAYYVWTPAEVDRELDAPAAALFKARFGLDGPPNFEGSHWHLVIARSLGELTEGGSDTAGPAQALEAARAKMLEARGRRQRPGLDDKLIAGWNGLAAAALARAGRLLGEPEWPELAARTLKAVRTRLFADGPPRAVWRNGESAHPATLEDHAFVLDAALELLAWRWRQDWLEFAEELAARIVEEFTDPQTGAMYLTPRRHEYLPARLLAHADDATPSGTGQAVLGLIRLGHLTGRVEWLQAAERALEAVGGDLERQPMAHATLLRARSALADPPVQVLLGGPGEEPDRWADELAARPELKVYRIPTGIPAGAEPGSALLDPLADAAEPTAVVCLGDRCLEPVHSLEALEARLTLPKAP